MRWLEPNNVDYGSDVEGGSSGGSSVQNFEVVAAGGATGRNAGVNRIVGVTLYGYLSHEPKVQGAAVPAQRWKDLLTMACADAGHCN